MTNQNCFLACTCSMNCMQFMHDNSFSIHDKYDELNLCMQKDTVVKCNFTYSYTATCFLHLQCHRTAILPNYHSIRYLHVPGLHTLLKDFDLPIIAQ